MKYLVEIQKVDKFALLAHFMVVIMMISVVSVPEAGYISTSV